MLTKLVLILVEQPIRCVCWDFRTSNRCFIVTAPCTVQTFRTNKTLIRNSTINYYYLNRKTNNKIIIRTRLLIPWFLSACWVLSVYHTCLIFLTLSLSLSLSLDKYMLLETNALQPISFKKKISSLFMQLVIPWRYYWSIAWYKWNAITQKKYPLLEIVLILKNVSIIKFIIYLQSCTLCTFYVC